MIGVQIAPAHPLRVCHRTEERMWLPREVSRLPGKVVQQAQQVPHIAFEGAWGRAASFCIDFGSRGCTTRPAQGSVQSDPFHEPVRHGDWSDGNSCRFPRLLAHRHAERVSEMTDHLWRCHFPPEPRAGRLNFCEAFDNLLLVRRICQISLAHEDDRMIDPAP